MQIILLELAGVDGMITICCWKSFEELHLSKNMILYLCLFHSTDLQRNIWWLLLPYTVVFTCKHFPLFWSSMPRKNKHYHIYVLKR